MEPSKIVQKEKVLAAKSDDLSLVPGFPVVEEEN